MENILALSPLDGRYAAKLKDLALVASEFGLIKLRVRVELEWFKFLHSKNEFGLTKLSVDEIKFIDQIINNFDEQSAYRVKQIEVETNHDVKAVEYFLQQQFQAHPRLKKSVSLDSFLLVLLKISIILVMH